MLRVLRVLVTGCGAPGIRGTLYALHHNPDGWKIRVVGADIRSDAVGAFCVDRFYCVPPPEDPAYFDRICDICETESIDLVIPQTTREIAVLSQCLGRCESHRFRIMVANEEAIRRANDKSCVLRLFQELELPYPAYGVARSESELVALVEQLGYPQNPVVVKPPVSNGMRGFRVLRKDAWDVDRFLNEKPSGTDVELAPFLAMLRRGSSWPELLVTEYLHGAEYSVDAFLGSHLSVAVPRLRRTIRSGISFDTVIERREDVAQYSLQAAKRLGLTYAFGFQFKLDAAGIPKVLECNPRVQGTMVTCVFGGVNVIWLGVREALGEPCEGPLQPPCEASFRRFWGGMGINAQGVDEI